MNETSIKMSFKETFFKSGNAAISVEIAIGFVGTVLEPISELCLLHAVKSDKAREHSVACPPAQQLISVQAE